MAISKYEQQDKEIISPKWKNLLIRIRAIAKSEHRNQYDSHRSAILNRLISVTILTDKDGEPVLWTEPKCQLVEPRLGVNDWLESL